MSFRFDKKLTIIGAGAILTMVVLYLLIGPLVAKVHRTGKEVKALEEEMRTARQAIESEGKFQLTGELLTRQKVSLAIDEITKTGAAHNINFVSISPQPIVKPAESPYPVLPIRMEVRSGYKDLAMFLGALERLQRSIVTVKSFEIDADPGTLPQLETILVVEVYLREGENG